MLDPNVYLLALAALAVSFVGFSSLVLTFRQCGGGKLSKLDAFLMRIFIQLGFLVAAGALLPPLLSLASIRVDRIWQFSSPAFAIPAILFAVTYPHRRRIASNRETPVVICIAVAVLCGASLLLIVNATGLFFVPSAFAYSASLTITFGLAGWGYLQALNLLVQDHLSHVDQ